MTQNAMESKTAINPQSTNQCRLKADAKLTKHRKLAYLFSAMPVHYASSFIFSQIFLPKTKISASDSYQFASRSGDALIL